MAYKGRFAAKKKKSGAKKVVLITISVFLLLVIGVGVAAVTYWYKTLGQINQAEGLESTMSTEEQQQVLDQFEQEFAVTEPVDDTEPTDALVEDEDDFISNTPKIINVLLVGQDMRPGQTWKLSDTMILCTVNLETKTLVMTSFLRDMYVKLPNYDGYVCGYNRLNCAYSLGWVKNGTRGSMEMLNMCLLENFGVQVDHNIEVDFNGFSQIVETMGGVEIELEGYEASHLNQSFGWALKSGVNHLNGEQALAYARIRKTDNDFYRANRQRTVINALLDKCRTLSISELNKLLNTVLPMITTNMDSNQITSYALEILPILPELQVVSQTIPADGTYRYANKGTAENPLDVIVPDLEANREILRQTIGG